MKTALRKWITWYLVAAMFVIGITPRVYAGFSPSEGIGLSPLDRPSDVQKIQKFLEIKMVRERLREFGFTPDEIQARLNHANSLRRHAQVLGHQVGIVAIHRHQRSHFGNPLAQHV